ncbi:MAG TPA: ABC transporter permease [Actinophytocola sp.]|uniref:ABC transporter permease n=1 Tax=Actinophytocola sp. TaxID=1872138 RepID=UPI002DBF9EA8|nr:ABC transporter permease [Actinophytocola sp.]HEU5476167.1 ABC transporter permease [Actinophytocola sp.]
MTEVAERTRGLGRVPGPVAAAFLVMEGYWTWYRRNWRSSAVSSVVQPVLFLLALGFGFGSQVQPGPATGGLSYVLYLTPALLVATAVQIAAFECTYPVLGSFKWQAQYVAIAATPITARQIVAGQLTWVAVRMTSSLLVFVAVAAVLGAVTGPAILISLVVAVLGGMAIGAPVTAYSATLETEGPFAGLFRFVILPMSLLAGTFFPVDLLPVWIRPLAWLTPLWHGTELARGAAFGGLNPWAALGHLGYLAALFALGAALAVRFFRRRLAK